HPLGTVKRAVPISLCVDSSLNGSQLIRYTFFLGFHGWGETAGGLCWNSSVRPCLRRRSQVVIDRRRLQYPRARLTGL
ncbi:hypothetical protein PFISCL1PPCAC_11669, partial [Pristionchus fissidentatus]